MARKSRKKTVVKPRFNPSLAVAVVAAVVVLGYVAVRTFAASGSAQLYLSPASATYTTGQDVGIQVYLNTGGDPVNAVEADFSYPTSKLQFVSIDATGSAFDIQASQSGGSGTVSIARGHAGNVTGTALVATVHFTALAAGSANLAFLNTSAVVRSTDNTNILTSTVGGNYTLNAPAQPTPTPTPAPAGGGGTSSGGSSSSTGSKTTTSSSGATGSSAGSGGSSSVSTASGATPTPAVATPTPAVAANPASSAQPFVNKTKPLFGTTNVLGLAAIAIPVLALLGLGGLMLSRLHRVPGVAGYGSDQEFVPPAPQATAPPPVSDPDSLNKTYYPGGGNPPTGGSDSGNNSGPTGGSGTT